MSETLEPQPLPSSQPQGGTATIERVETRELIEPGDAERFAHYVRKEKILESAMSGEPVIALCGKLSATPQQVAAIGLKTAISINREERPLAEMLANTAANLEHTAAGLEI